MPSLSVGRVSVLRDLDVKLLRIARTRWHTPALERALGRFSYLGEHGAVWFAIGIAGHTLEHEHRDRWRAATASIAGAYALNTALKVLVARKRPGLPGLPALTDTPTQLSFPSAHACTSFAGAVAFTSLGLPATPLYALAVSLSFSRLYLGVHYPSDVLAGALLGSTFGATGRTSGAE